LGKLNASINIDIREFKRELLHLQNVDFSAELQNGILEIPDAGFDINSGWIRTRWKAESAKGIGKVSMEAMARNFSPGISVQDPDDVMTSDLDIKLDSSGVDVRSLAANANGMILVDARGGRLANSQALQAVYGNMLTEILNVINPFYKAEPYTDIECVVLALSIEDGNILSAPRTYFGTDKVRLFLQSAIDLKSEAIDLNIEMRPQQGLAISSGELFNSFIKVTGTLAAPRLAVDETGVLVSGGTAVATGGLSILAKMAWDRLSRSKDPCNDVAKEGKKALAKRFPSLGERR
jgi:hypothetical protein